MTKQETIIKLASMAPQIERMQVPSYLPGASDLEKLKEAMILIINLLTVEGGES